MSWVYLDDRFFGHPKVLKAGGDAGWLFLASLAYSNQNDTGGQVPKAIVSRLTDRKQIAKLSSKLCEVMLWHDKGDHYVIHDYGEWNKTAVQKREQGRKAAQARWGKRDSTPGGDAQALPEHMPEQCRDDAGAMPPRAFPTPTPTPKTTSSSVPATTTTPALSLVPPTPTIDAALRLIAENALARREGEMRKRVGNRRAWLTKVAAELRIDHAIRLADIEPTAFTTVEELADWIEPPPKTRQDHSNEIVESTFWRLGAS